MVNRFDQAAVHDAMLHSAIAAVAEGFPHLPVAAIIDPPHRWFDAALARQIVGHMLAREFHVPHRRVQKLQGRAREGVHRGMRTIDERLGTPAFATQYRRMAERATFLLRQQMNEAEAA